MAKSKFVVADVSPYLAVHGTLGKRKAAAISNFVIDVDGELLILGQKTVFAALNIGRDAARAKGVYSITLLA